MVTTSGLPYITKTCIPKRSGHAVHRERLSRALMAGLGKKVQIIWAPAGNGKTALLVDVVSGLQTPVCWYSFSPDESDPSTFLQLCLRAVRTEIAGFGDQYRPLVGGDFGMDPRELMGFFISALHSDVESQIVFVFDDVHWLEGKPELEDLLSLLIERSPDNVRFLLGSRVWPALSCLPKLAAGNELGLLDSNDLRFSVEETVDLLSNMWDRTVSIDTAKPIHVRTGGWVAAILLTSKTPSHEFAPHPLGYDDNSMLFDYLSEEVFDGLDCQLQTFLLQTSVLQEFTPALCDRLLELGNSQELIHQIRERGLFLEERSGETSSYAYHDLFREFLIRRLRLDLPQQYERVNKLAAHLYQDIGLDDNALHHYLQIDDTASALALVKEVSGSYFDKGNWAKLSFWLSNLPAKAVEADLELRLLHGQVDLRMGEPAKSLERLDRLIAEGNGGGQAVMGQAWVAKSTAYRRLGHLDLSVKSAETGLEILERVGASNEDIAEAHRQLASALATQGKLDLGKRHYQAALDIAAKDNIRLISQVYSDLGTVCIELGLFDEAAVHLEQARAGWLKLGSDGPLAQCLVNVSLIYFHNAEFDLALEEVNEAVRLSEVAAYPRVLALALMNQGIIQLALGSFDDSIESSSRALEMARKLLDQRLVGESTNTLGEGFRKLGETSKAATLLNQALLEAQHSGQEYITAIYHISLGKVYCQEASYERAHEHFNCAKGLFEELNSNNRLAEINLFQAEIFYRTGNLDDTREHLAAASRLISEQGIDGYMLMDGREVLDVIGFGAARRIGGETFVRLTARLMENSSADEESRDAQPNRGKLAALQAYGLGAPRVVLGSHQVRDVEWRSRKARELFYFLLCNQRPTNNEEILDALWPEASVNFSDSVIKTNVYRLRQALFYDCVLVSDTGYRINPAVQVEFDVAEFQSLLGQAGRLDADDQEREELLRRATGLYQGPFLHGCYSDWCVDLRNDLELNYHMALQTLAEYHTERSHFVESNELLKKVIDGDPYNEEAQFRVIENYLRANEPLPAMEHLRRYAKLCREDLGIQLSRRFAECQEKILERISSN